MGLRKGQVRPSTETVTYELWLGMSQEEWRRKPDIMQRYGRKDGNPLYTSLLRVLVFKGAAESRRVRTAGRSAIEYRRRFEVYYPVRKDPRFKYVKWDQLDQVSRHQAYERYERHYEWLDWGDWEYPVTVKGGVQRLGKGLRVLGIPPEEAEGRRTAWRMKDAAMFV